jgi:hypothetical protein
MTPVFEACDLNRCHHQTHSQLTVFFCAPMFKRISQGKPTATRANPSNTVNMCNAFTVSISPSKVDSFISVSANR